MRLLGLNLMTDYEPLAEAVTHMQMEPDNSVLGRAFEAAFPGLFQAVLEGQKELSKRRVRATDVFYFNYRVQVWALGFDVDPAPLVRVLPTGVEREETVH